VIMTFGGCGEGDRKGIEYVARESCGMEHAWEEMKEGKSTTFPRGLTMEEWPHAWYL
jgi:hypothetical protein